MKKKPTSPACSRTDGLKAEREALFVDAEVELLKHQLFSSLLDATSEGKAKKHQTTGAVI